MDCGIALNARGPAPMPLAPRSWTRSFTCASTTTSAPKRSRCTCGATTTSRSASPACGGSCTGWTWADCRPRRATSATTGAGRAMRSSGRAITSRSTSSSSNHCQPGLQPGRPREGKRLSRWAGAASSTSSRPSTTAPGYGSCGSTRATTRRPRSSSPTTCSPSCPSRSKRFQTDNGAEFQSAFHWHVLDQGINLTYIKPRTPRLGKVERSHRIDAEEFYRLLDGVVIDDVNIFNAKLKEWQDYYNYHRPHGGLNGQTPYERLRQKTQTEARV